MSRKESKVRKYSFDLLPEELKKAVKKTPKVKFENVRRARFGISMMHLFMPKVDTAEVKIEDRRIKNPHSKKDLEIRIYTPADNKSKKRIGMIFMHWGGFVVGNLKTEHDRCVRLSRTENIVVVSVKYRLAPENPYPSALRDCEVALEWFYSNCKEYGVFDSNIGVGGTSAGGGLAASLSLDYLRKGRSIIQFQYLGFPVLDARCETYSSKLHTDTPNWTSEANKLMWKYYLQDQKPNEIASPSLASNLNGLPFTFLWTAEFDPLHDEAVNFYNQLISDNVEVLFKDYDSCIHGFDSIPNAEGIISRAHQDQKAFFEKVRVQLSNETN